MKKLNQNELLDQKIAQLTIQHKRELEELKEQFHLVQSSLTSTNIVQEGINGFYQTVTNKENLVSTIVSIVGGYVSKKVIVGSSENPIKKVVGNVLQFLVTGYLSKMNHRDQTN
jgi:hypothetical protein